MKISVCILINQWHEKLPETLSSYAECSSEILLGINGDFRPENHPELKQLNKIRTIPLQWNGYGATKNELASFAKNDWILSVDTDEAADVKLQKAIASCNPDNNNIIYALGMCHYLGNKPVLHGAWSAGKRNFLRLYNRNHTQWNNVPVHEQIQVQADSQIIRLPGKINHYTVTSYQQFLEKNKHYAQLSAEKYKLQKKTVFPGQSWVSAGFNFIKNYFFRLGFLDGKAGWQIAKGTALYTYWKYSLLAKK